MNSVGTDVASMLTTAGFGTLGTEIHVGREPETPNNTITIFETPGRGLDLTMDSYNNFSYEYKAVQIRVRNEGYVAGEALIRNITMSLHGRAQQTVGDTLYSVIYCSSGPAVLEWDNNNRIIFIVNLEIQRRKKL
jgi:hypothetical protein